MNRKVEQEESLYSSTSSSNSIDGFDVLALFLRSGVLNLRFDPDAPQRNVISASFSVVVSHRMHRIAVRVFRSVRSEVRLGDGFALTVQVIRKTLEVGAQPVLGRPPGLARSHLREVS